MKLIPGIILLVILIIIFYQDIKYRAVSWILFPFVAICSFISASYQLELKAILWNTMLNVVFVSLQLIILTIYFSIKNKKFTLIHIDYLGIGDILFLYAISSIFTPINFIVFLIGSFFITLIFYSTYFSFSKHEIKHIPLAGFISFILVLLMIFELVSKNEILLNDSILYNLIY